MVYFDLVIWKFEWQKVTHHQWVAVDGCDDAFPCTIQIGEPHLFLRPAPQKVENQVKNSLAYQKEKNEWLVKQAKIKMISPKTILEITKILIKIIPIWEMHETKGGKLNWMLKLMWKENGVRTYSKHDKMKWSELNWKGWKQGTRLTLEMMDRSTPAVAENPTPEKNGEEKRENWK